jgi:UDP-N-acetylmuramate--alanine ligase
MAYKSIKTKLRVGVFMGGKSIEHEVSFNSARTICDHLDTEMFVVVPIYQTIDGDLYILPYKFLHRGKTLDFRHRLTNEAKKVFWDDLKNLVDFAYLAVHGRYAEDGTIQGMLDVLNVPYLGAGIFTSSLCMSKAKQKEYLKKRGMKVPGGIILEPVYIKKLLTLDSEKIIKNILDKLKVEKINFPYIVKPSSEGSSFGISVVFSQEDLFPAIKKAAICDSRIVQTVLVEEKIEGMEFVCMHIEQTSNSLKEKDGVGNRKWLGFPITEIVPEGEARFFDYEQKYMPGRAKKIVPARCSKDEEEKIKKICLDSSEILGFSTLSRIDGFLKKDSEVIITDINTITGMGPSTFIFHQAAEIGISHTELINHLIKTDLRNYGLIDNMTNLKNGIEKKEMLDHLGVSDNLKIKVVVLLGGESREREISLESGRNVCYKLSPNKYEVIPVFVDEKMELFRLSQKFLVKNSTREISELLTSDIKIKWSDLTKLCDFVFIALHGGKGEGGCVQGALEMFGLPYNGAGVFASSLCMDKHKANFFLKDHGFDVTYSVLVEKEYWNSLRGKNKKSKYLRDLIVGIDFPLILKPHDDGCSFFVKKIKNIEDLSLELDLYFESEKSVAMIEELIVGYELTCGVIGNEKIVAFPPSHPAARGDVLSIEEKFLPGAGENQTPANLPEKALRFVMKTMEQVYRCIGCKGYARIDCFYQDAYKSKTGKERVIILEINTLPALSPATCIFHQASEVKITPMKFIDKIVDLGFDNHKQDIELIKEIKEKDFKLV